MKKITAILAAVFAATSAAAGSLVYTPPADIAMIEEGAPMGGSGDWLVPLILLGLLALALTQDSGDAVQPNGRG